MYLRLLSFNHEKNSSYLLLGPRGTGKTYWLNHYFNQSLVFNLLKTDVYIELLANPELLKNKIPKDFKDWIIIDEVQRIPQLLNEVHWLIEEKGYKFILTGSSARKLNRESLNLLAGRALKCSMHPLTVHELGSDFIIEKALKFGLLPQVYKTTDPKHYLETYVLTYLQEEVLQEGLVRNLGDFARFLKIASFSQGETLNMSAIAREVSMNQKAVVGYFEILEDLMLGFKLPVFTKRAQRQLVSHPKFYFFDVGVYRALRPRGPLDKEEEVDGSALETLFLQNLRAYNDYFRWGYEFFYWRTKSGVEVDIVAYGEKGLIAIEVKRKSRIHSSDLKGLKAFHEDYPMAQSYVFYGGDIEENYDFIQALPFMEAFKKLGQIFDKKSGL